MRKTTVCPFCRKKFSSEDYLETHLEKVHGEQLHGRSPAHFLFDLRNKTAMNGTCIMHKKVSSCLVKTSFNEKSKKYNRLCKNPKCKEAYVLEFRERMNKIHGKDHLLNDPEVQKKMLENRKISGEYKWDKDFTFVFTGNYEKEFLEFMQLIMEWDPEDLFMPAPFEIKYKYDGKEHFYIPDVYIRSLNLVIEIKGDNGHYRQRDLEKEKAKDKAVEKSSYNYLKIVDKNHSEFINGLSNRKWKK